MVYDTDICPPSTLSMFSWPVDEPADRSSYYKVLEQRGNDLQSFGWNSGRTAKIMPNVNTPLLLCKELIHCVLMNNEAIHNSLTFLTVAFKCSFASCV